MGTVPESSSSSNSATQGNSAGKSRRGRKPSVRALNRFRFFELCASFLKEDIFPLWLARTKEALDSWDHKHCFDVWRQIALIQGEVVSAGMQPDRSAGDGDPADQPGLPFGREDMLRMMETARMQAAEDDALAKLAAPTVARQ